MAAPKNFASAFEGQLAAALKQAAIHAAAGLIRSNPELTLEDFYTVMRPQGVTETITVGDLANALAGKPISDTPPAVASAPARRAVAPAPAAAKPAAAPAAASAAIPMPRKPRRVPSVDCTTRDGRRAYHSAILHYLGAVGGWTRFVDIYAYCGGESYQFGDTMRKYLIPAGLVKTRGNGPGKYYGITAKGIKHVRSGLEPSGIEPAAAPAKPAVDTSGEVRIPKPRRPSKPPHVNCLSQEGFDAYKTAILRYLAAANTWVSGPQVRVYCGGTKGQLNTMMRKHLEKQGLVLTRGEFNGKRYAISAKGRKLAISSMNAAGNSSSVQPKAVLRRGPQAVQDYHDAILKFLKDRKWRSGTEISDAVGGTIGQRRHALKILVDQGAVERNDGYTNKMRYRLIR